MSQLVCYFCCDNCRLVSNDHILLLQKCLYIYIYIYIYLSSFLKRRQSNIWFLSPKKLSLSFPIKNLFLWEQEHWCSEGSGILSCTRSGPTGCRILGEEHNQIFLPVQWGVYSLRITFTRFNPGYIFLSLLYFFLVLIVCYNALFMCCQLNLFCYCYFVI